MKWSSWLWIILLILFVIWISTPDNPSNSYNFTSIDEDESDYQLSPLEEKSISNINPNAYYWKYIPIHYYFSEDYPCEGSRKNNIKKSFNIIEEKTDKIVTFYEEESEYAIEIICYDEYESEEVSAYGGIYNYEGDKEILSGFVELYKEDPINFEQCQNYPSIELHEILHAFGFNHIEDRKSIMSSVEDCTRLDPEIIDCLKHIYSKGQENYTCQGIPFIY